MATADEDAAATRAPHASTAAPPTGKDGVSVAHAAATSAGGGGVEEPETIVTVEDDADVCPKASGSTTTAMMDTALRARRRTAGPGGGASPYAKPTKRGKEGGYLPPLYFFFGIESLIYIFSCLTHTPLIILFPTPTHTHARTAQSYLPPTP